MVVHPSYVRSNSDFLVHVELFKKAVNSEKITAEFVTIDANNIKRSALVCSVSLKPGMLATDIILSIPADFESKSYQLEVNGTGDVSFNTSNYVYFLDKSMSIFIRTDKAQYKPGQLVQYRVFAVDPGLKPKSVILNIEIFDSKGNKLSETNDVQNIFGTAGSFQLSDMPVQGSWHITAKVKGTETQESYYFQDEEYGTKICKVGVWRRQENRGTVKNVYLFPGVPSILEKAFVLLKDLFQNPYAEFHTREVYIQHDEVSITHILNKVNAAYSKDVIMGSYPNFKSSYYKVKVTLESENKNRLEEAHTALVKALPEGSIVKYEKDPIASAIRQIHDIVESDDQSKYTCNVRKAVQVIEECLERYSLDEICVGFNGGKDCTVLLHLFHAVKMRKFPTCTQKTKCLYIKSRSPFPEVEKFIQITRDNYKLDMLNFSGRIKECLGELQKQHPEIKSVIMGTRVTDPYSAHLEAFSMTDSDWPQFMRVNPLLDWSYNDVWKFLRSLCLPYCTLYDRGYTSLGCMNNTHPNPSLQYIDERGVVCYKPAYELELESQERDGRN